MRAKLRGKREQGLIRATGCGELHAAVRAGNGNSGHASQTEGRRVAQQTGPRLAVIGAGRQARNGNRGKQEQPVFGEKIVHARAEPRMALPQCGDFVRRQASAPFEAITDRRFKAIEVAGVQPRGF